MRAGGAGRPGQSAAELARRDADLGQGGEQIFRPRADPPVVRQIAPHDAALADDQRRRPSPSLHCLSSAWLCRAESATPVTTCSNE